jgi:hypothetical protein
MCEAYGSTFHSAWKDSAQRGVNFLVKAQRRNPSGKGVWGWRYMPRDLAESEESKKFYEKPVDWERAKTESDTSVTTWVVMALKSAELCGLEVPHSSMEGAMDFVRSVTSTKDGRVAYMDIRQVGRKIEGEGQEFLYHETTMAALGMCVRTFVEKNINDPVLELSAKRILNDLPTVSKDKMSVDYYYWYYGTLALNQYDGPDSPKRTGKYWNPWNKAMVDVLLPLQDKTQGQNNKPTGCAHGGWTTQDRWGLTGGPIYRTALNVLTLEVYYRYANAFGASMAAKKPGKPDSKVEGGPGDRPDTKQDTK